MERVTLAGQNHHYLRVRTRELFLQSAAAVTLVLLQHQQRRTRPLFPSPGLKRHINKVHLWGKKLQMWWKLVPTWFQNLPRVIWSQLDGLKRWRRERFKDNI